MNEMLASGVVDALAETATVDAADAPYFLLRSPQQAMEAHGVRARLPSATDRYYSCDGRAQPELRVCGGRQRVARHLD